MKINRISSKLSNIHRHVERFGKPYYALVNETDLERHLKAEGDEYHPFDLLPFCIDEECIDEGRAILVYEYDNIAKDLLLAMEKIDISTAENYSVASLIASVPGVMLHSERTKD